MNGLWRHIEHNYREGGLGQIFYKVWVRFRQWLWSETVSLVYRVNAAGYHRAPVLTLSCSHLGFDSLQDLYYFKAIAFPEQIQSRLNSGAVCNGFFLDRELANIAWTSDGYLEVEPGVRIREESCVGIFDCYTLPAHRSKGIYADTLVRLIGEVRDKGVTAALIAVDPDNYPSIKGIERVGFQPFYRLTRVRRFGRQRLRRSEFAPITR